MRADLLDSTALLTTIALEARAEDLAIPTDFMLPVATAPQDRTAGFLGISAHSLCSDGEIFLAGELPVEIALRR